MATNLFFKMTDIAKREGFSVLIHKIITFPARRHMLGMRWEARYYHEYDLQESRNEEDFMPAISNFSFHIVRNTGEADKLEANGYEFRSQQSKARLALESGAIAFCIFVEQECAHIGWVALDEKAKPPIDDWLKVDFANKEACTGATLTIPKYEGNGFMKYGYYKRLEFMRQMGVVKSKASIGTYNYASLHVHAKFNPRRYTRVRYLKILGREFWKETPLDHSFRHPIA